MRSTSTYDLNSTYPRGYVLRVKIRHGEVKRDLVVRRPGFYFCEAAAKSTVKSGLNASFVTCCGLEHFNPTPLLPSFLTR